MMRLLQKMPSKLCPFDGIQLGECTPLWNVALPSCSVGRAPCMGILLVVSDMRVVDALGLFIQISKILPEQNKAGAVSAHKK